VPDRRWRPPFPLPWGGLGPVRPLSRSASATGGYLRRALEHGERGRQVSLLLSASLGFNPAALRSRNQLPLEQLAEVGDHEVGVAKLRLLARTIHRHYELEPSRTTSNHAVLSRFEDHGSARIDPEPTASCEQHVG
jgi:hypothetical protein